MGEKLPNVLVRLVRKVIEICIFLDGIPIPLIFWIFFQSMISPRSHYSLVSYGDALFAIGGYNGGELNTMERYTRGNGWTAMANLPDENHR